MDEYLLAVGSALWLGLLTSISPCPLAGNIAAVSYLGKKVDSPRLVLISGLLYTIGRLLAYLLIGIILVTGLLAVYEISDILQSDINKFLGPLLIITGLFLLGLFKFNFKGTGVSEKLQKKADKSGLWGALFLGLIFALSFCPVSAALFFGSLVPLAVKHQSNLLMPAVYGIGTALPVIVFAFLIALGTKYVAIFFNNLSKIEKYARWLTGGIFVVVGLYYSLIYLFGIPL